MKEAIMLYVSHHQTQLHPLRELLKRCERYGLAVERSDQRILNYRIVGLDGDDVAGRNPLTGFMSISKLALWMDGFEKGYNNKQNSKDDE